METTNGMRLTLTRTACKQAVKHGLTADIIQECFDNPVRVSASKTRDGQYRIVSKQVCIVGVPVNDTEFRGITMYAREHNNV